jgi:hypothetical protein
MSAFVFGDMHGRWDCLEALLQEAGILDNHGQRISDDMVISIGDLINATVMDVNNDEEILRRSEGVVDYWILGNHEACYSYPHLAFNGFSPNPVIKTLYFEWLHKGKLVPAVSIANTLLTHAGVNKVFDFGSAEDAFDAIWDLWINYYEYANPIVGGSTSLSSDLWWGMSPSTLLDGIGSIRGGRSQIGGILWDDWSQPKNTRFSQIVGHTPHKEGPVLHRYLGSNVFTLNIDTAAKRGLSPWGVWVNSSGEIEDFVSIKENHEEQEASE